MLNDSFLLCDVNLVNGCQNEGKDICCDITARRQKHFLVGSNEKHDELMNQNTGYQAHYKIK